MTEQEKKKNQTKNKEIRLFAENLEVRSAGDPDKMIVEGYAVVFESEATHSIWGSDYTEVISRNAFDGCDLKDVPLKYNHSDNFLILARTRNKSLQLELDEKGLKVKAELIDTQSNRDIYKSLQCGLLDKMSFCFTVSEETYDVKANKRTINKIENLYDVSIVDVPFYDTTEIYARALDSLDNERKQLDNLQAKKRLLQKKITLRNNIIERGLL